MQSKRSENNLIPPPKGPMVSVVMPTCDRHDLLDRALNSVLSQTYQDFEIIVVNDAGENINQILENIGNTATIKYLAHEKRSGVAAARNTALKQARGKYIAYLDDDDVYYPDHLETLISYLETEKATVAYTDAHELIQTAINDRDIEIGQRRTYSEPFDPQRLLIHNYIPTLTIAHRRDTLEETGLFDESLASHEDWDLWIRLSRLHSFQHIQKVTAAFTSRGKDTSLSSSDPQSLLEAVRRIQLRYAHLAKNPEILKQQQTVLENMALKASSANGSSENLVAAMEQKDALISSMHISARDKDRELGEKNQRLMSLDTELGEKNHCIISLESELEQTTQRLVALDRELNQKLQEKDRLLEQQHLQLQGKDALLQENENILLQHKQQLQAREETLQQIYASTSWKILTFLMRLVPFKRRNHRD